MKIDRANFPVMLIPPKRGLELTAIDGLYMKNLV